MDANISLKMLSSASTIMKSEICFTPQSFLESFASKIVHKNTVPGFMNTHSEAIEFKKPLMFELKSNVRWIMFY